MGRTVKLVRVLTVPVAVFALVGLVISVVIAGAEVNPTTAIGSPGTRVVVIGDSITYLTAPAFNDRFAQRRYAVPVVSGIPGIRSDQRVDEAPHLVRPHRPDVVVLELGANDVGQLVHDHPGASDEQRRWHALSVVVNNAAIADRAGPSVRCVVMVNVSGNTLTDEANEGARAVNRAIDAWAKRDARVRVADWHSVVHDELTRGEPDGAMTTDMVHPTEHGAGRLADLVVETIDRCPR